MLPTTRSARILGRHWKLTVIAILSLSIAMALGVLSLSALNTFLLLPPAAPAADRLVMIYARSESKSIDQISYPDFTYFRENNHVFTDVAAAPNAISINGSWDDGRMIKVATRPVSDNYFAVMGLRPYLGRWFSPGDDQAKTSLAVMTYACWKRLGADPRIVGKVVTGYTIVGVAPKEFTGSFYGLNGDLLTTLSRTNSDSSWFTKRDARQLILLARLKPGVSRRQAQAEIETLSGQLASAYPADDKNRHAILTRATLLPPDAIPTAELITGLLMALVLLVLLIACTNVANLLLAVAVGRRQEAGIKLALGARRGRIIREFLTETAVICAASAALGYLLAAVVVSRYSNFTVEIPMIGEVSIGLNFHLDGAVITFTLALMLIAIFTTGMAPAWYASSPNLAQILSGEVVVGGTRKRLHRSALVIVQVTVCTLVLVGMGLCQRSLYNLRHVDPGFSARNLVAVTVYPKSNGQPQARLKALQSDLRRAVSSLPGVEAVSLASSLPVALGSNSVPVQISGSNQKLDVGQVTVDADYFRTFGIPLLSGRVFNASDREGSPDVIVINHKMAEMLWPGQDPVGRTVLTGDPPRKAIVVGVAMDGKYDELDEPSRPFFYLALSQHFQESISIVARTKGDPRFWIEPLAQAVHPFDVIILLRPITYDRWINFTLLVERITTACVTALSALGLLLAIVGLFGAISYSVSERRKELGIRVALGARPWQLLKMVLRQTLFISGVGVSAGILLGEGAGMLLRSQFYGIGAVEWTVLLPVTLAMLAVSLLVAYLSARSWITIDPMEAVRHS